MLWHLASKDCHFHFRRGLPQYVSWVVALSQQWQGLCDILALQKCDGRVAIDKQKIFEPIVIVNVTCLIAGSKVGSVLIKESDCHVLFSVNMQATSVLSPKTQVFIDLTDASDSQFLDHCVGCRIF